MPDGNTGSELRPLSGLCLYAKTQTFTNTVFDHLSALSFSEHEWMYADIFQLNDLANRIHDFSIVALHYSVRIAYRQVPIAVSDALIAFRGLKILFIQDEYDRVSVAREEIVKLGFQIVYSCVPATNLEVVYPKRQFPQTTFVSVLTGYVPTGSIAQPHPPSQRRIAIGYRGRVLPIRYGQLAMEKRQIGEVVRQHCREHGVSHDIELTEDQRLYGESWTRFVLSCRAMLGTESGSNVFDFNSDLESQIADYRAKHPTIDDETMYKNVIAPLEMPGVMNQISPKLFEMIQSRTVCILYPGSYSEVLEPYKHYVPLRRDHSNINEVVGLILDDGFVDELSRYAYDSIIATNRWDYCRFASIVDDAIRQQIITLREFTRRSGLPSYGDSIVTELPLKTELPSRYNMVANRSASVVRVTLERISLALRKTVFSVLRKDS